ncbi:unnamed protein product [Urochloa humidicola]
MRPLLLLALCGGLLFSQPTPSYSAATDTLTLGRSFGSGDRLVSGNGKFALGFFQMGTGNLLNWYLGIWFNKVPKLTPVWTANRDHPISGPASPELRIGSDGNLAVLAQGTIWSTKINITANNDTTIAVLLDSGNLVLRSSSNSSRIFWESFDYPSDTQLPGAKIGWNKVTGLNRYTVSRKNSIDLSSGIYSSMLDLDGIGRNLWNSSVVYWSTGEWNGRFFSSIPEMSAGSSLANFTLVNNDQEVYFTYDIFDENAVIINVLDVNGQKQLRAWTGQDWFTINDQPRYQCDVYAACGPFTVCTSNADPYCNCMKGFSVRSPADWEIEDRTGGCIRNTPLNCRSGNGTKTETGMADKFYSMPGIRLPQNGTIIPSASSVNECAQVCLNNCSCTAYSYDKDGCSIWHNELLNVATDSNGEMLYLRLAAKELQNRKRSKSGMIIGMTIGATTATLAGFIFLVLIWRSRNRKLSSHKMDNDQGGVGIIAFRYVDLQYATKKFSEKLGTGGFGSVFTTRKVVIGDIPLMS